MKKGTEDAIASTVSKAKSDVNELLKNGRAFSYLVLTEIMADAYPIKRLVAFKRLLVYSLLMSNPPIFKYLVLLIETIGQLVMLCFGYWPFFCSG